MASHDPLRPNILMVLTDDQGAWALGCAGNAEIRTPHLDRLAASGARFENFFCASPVCSPARATILTGRMPSQHGIHDWLRRGNTTSEGELIEYLHGQPGYTDYLAAAGYTCGMSGKWHLGDSHHPQKGFTFWEVHATGGGPYYNAPMIHAGEVYRAPGYVTDHITDNGLLFLEQQLASDAPFYLSVHYTAPHSPWDRANHPAALYDAYYAGCPFRSTPRLPMHPWQITTAPYGRDEETRRQVLSGYFAAVTSLDANVGRLIDWLEGRGLRQNTLLIFNGDNGMNMGHHGVYGKGNGTFPLNMYDTAVKVPMILSRPGSIPAGQVCRELLSHYDLLPTLLDYAGLAPAQSAIPLPGHSFTALLHGEEMPRPELVCVYDAVLDEYGPVRMIRTAEWKYVHRFVYGPHELYHLTEDPNEEHNLVAEPGQQARVAELKGEMDEWFFHHVDPAMDGSREPAAGSGQVNWAGAKSHGQKAFEQDWKYMADALADQEAARRTGAAFI